MAVDPLLRDMRFLLNPASSLTGRLESDKFFVVVWLACDLETLLELAVEVLGKIAGLLWIRLGCDEVLDFKTPDESLSLI